MGLIFYKPNKNNTGSACQWSFNSKGDDKAVYLELFKQTGWDETTENGKFSGGEKLNLKFSYTKEVGGLIRVLENIQKVVLDSDGKTNSNPGQKATFFHTSPKGTRSIDFVKTEWKGNVLYGLTVRSKDENGAASQFRISFDADEAVVLKEWLKFALTHIFSGVYSEDKKRYEEGKDKKKGE